MTEFWLNYHFNVIMYSNCHSETIHEVQHFQIVKSKLTIKKLRSPDRIERLE